MNGNAQLDDGEEQYRQYKRAQEFVQPYLARAERDYAQSISGIWLGNAGATVTLLGLVGTIARDKPLLVHLLFWSLSIFVLGLITMGIGTFASIIRDGARARRLERIENILEIRMDDIQSPTETLGLTFRDFRTVTACIAAALFVFGAFWALAVFAIAF